MLEKLKSIIKLFTKGADEKASSAVRELLVNLVFIVFLAYFSSSVVISVFVKNLLPKEGGAISVKGVDGFGDEADQMNYRSFQKAVLERNLFNESGELPEETEEASELADMNPEGKFSLEGPCTPTNLKLKLLGTIVLSNKKSFATVREEGVAFSDIYQADDQVFGQEAVKVVEVRNNVVILNNAGKKECLYATEVAAETGAKGQGLKKKSKDLKSKKSDSKASGGETVKLEASWVQKQLGSGFTKIMQSISTPPNVVDGGIRGFKFYGIRSGSLLGKIGLSNGDVVLGVNGNSTNDSVFVLYQALNDETEVIIRYERSGEERSVKVLIE